VYAAFFEALHLSCQSVVSLSVTYHQNVAETLNLIHRLLLL